MEKRTFACMSTRTDMNDAACNTRKSLASFFIVHILCQFSSPAKHLSQKVILEMLANPPYSVDIERKAVSRILHSLAETDFGFFVEARGGAWYDQKTPTPWSPKDL